MRTSYKCFVGAAIIAILVMAISLPAMAAGGRIIVKGSDTLLPLASAWAEAYMEKHPNVMVSVTGGGSGVGFASLIAGSCDVADASRAIKPKEVTGCRDRNVDPKATTVAKDGIAIIVHPDNPIKNITIADLAKLYSGADNWKNIGGQNMKVIAAGRDSSSGTYVFFQDTVLKGRRYRSDMLTLPSNAAICQTVSQDKGAIGYVGIAYAKEFEAKHKVKAITVGGIPANDETVKSGKYPLWRPLYCYTNGRPGGIVSDYLKFATSAEGQSIVSQVGYIPR